MHASAAVVEFCVWVGTYHTYVYCIVLVEKVSGCLQIVKAVFPIDSNLSLNYDQKEHLKIPACCQVSQT